LRIVDCECNGMQELTASMLFPNLHIVGWTGIE
jgi:hypothetical protein